MTIHGKKAKESSSPRNTTNPEELFPLPPPPPPPPPQASSSEMIPPSLTPPVTTTNTATRKDSGELKSARKSGEVYQGLAVKQITPEDEARSFINRCTTQPLQPLNPEYGIDSLRACANRRDWIKVAKVENKWSTESENEKTGIR